MAFFIDDNGNITLIQGDSFNLVVDGLPTDKNYTVYLAIKNANRVTMGNELSVQTGGEDSVTFAITAALTDLLTVPRGEESAEYYYGIKICSTNTVTQATTEETLLLGDLDIAELNTITVYPKRVEGLS